VRHWQKSRGIFTHSGLKRANIDTIKGVYVPAYLYTALAHTSYRAQIGENYQETETYTTTDSNGNTVTRTRTVTKTEWRSLHGRHSSYVTDVLVTASRGVTNAELELVEPFDYRGLRRYAPGLLSGWIAEDPTMTVEECVALARAETLQVVGQALGGFMPGDSHRELAYQTNLERETIDLVHVPLWVLAVRHDPQKPPVRVLVNGQTARVWGKAPLSWVKIVLAVVGVLAPIVAVVIWIWVTAEERRHSPPPPQPRVVATAQPQPLAPPPQPLPQPQPKPIGPTAKPTSKPGAKAPPTAAPKPTGSR
jgi:hypothetical protein